MQSSTHRNLVHLSLCPFLLHSWIQPLPTLEQGAEEGAEEEEEEEEEGADEGAEEEEEEEIDCRALPCCPPHCCPIPMSSHADSSVAADTKGIGGSIVPVEDAEEDEAEEAG